MLIPQSSDSRSEPKTINFSTGEERHEDSICMRLSRFSVQEFQRRELDGEIRTYYAVKSGYNNQNDSIIIPVKTGEVENERDAVLCSLSRLLGFDVSIEMLPPRQYTEVAVPKSCEVYPLPLEEFFELGDSLPLFNLCPAYNKELAHYAIFDPRDYRDKGTSMPLLNWVNLYGRRKTTAKDPCLLYCRASYYGDVGILGRQIDDQIFLPVIYNAKLVVVPQDGKYDDSLTNEAICYLRYYPHDDPRIDYSSADSRIIGTFNCMAHWYVVPDPGNYIDWQSLFAIYDSYKNSYQ